MDVTASIVLPRNGIATEFKNLVKLQDIDENGVIWSRLIQEHLRPGTELLDTLAALLNTASACAAHGRPLDEIAALRIARRLTGGGLNQVSQMIKERQTAGAFRPKLDAGWRIVSLHEEPEAFLALFQERAVCSNFVHPGARYDGLFGVQQTALYPEDGSTDNVSFAILKDEQVVAVVPCLVQGDHILSWVAAHLPAGGLPIKIHLSGSASTQNNALALALQYMNHLCRTFGAQEMCIQEPMPANLGLYKLVGRSQVFSAELWDRPVVNLEQTEAALFSAVRKSYKSQINWGRQHLQMTYWSGDQITKARAQEIYNIIQHCHQKVIQKYGDGMTLSMFMQPIIMCQMGRGEVAIAKTADGMPCGITVVTDEDGISFYALGGSTPLDNKNPGQFIVYDSILRAKARGNRSYHVNRAFSAPISQTRLNTQVKTVHDMNLIFFKRGFSDTQESFQVYKVLPDPLERLQRGR